MIFSRKRVLVLIGSVIVTLGSGTNYGYSAYAPQLGDALHITHTQLNIIGLAGNMGVYFTSPFIGRLVDLKGPRILLMASFFLLLGGYSGIKWFYDRATTPSTIGFLFLVFASFATGVGGNCGITAAMNTTAKSFPDRMRATTTSTVAAGYGLSAFLFATIAHTIFPGNTSGFLLVLSIGTALPMLVGLALVKVAPHTDAIAIPSYSQTRHSIEVVPERDERRHSENWEVYTAVVGPGGYERLTESDIEDELMEASVAQPFLRQDSREHLRSGTTDLEVELSPSRRNSTALPHPETRRHHHSRSRSRSLVRPHEHADIYGWNLLQNSEFWVLFLTMCCLSGTGLMYLNNVGSIAQALFARGDPKFDTVESAKWQAAQVSITSIANCLGRVMFGSVADFAKNRYDWRRSYFVSIISFTFIISQLVLYYTSSVQMLWMSSATLGFGYGGMFGLFPTLMIEWFGLAHFSQNWGFLCISPVIAGNLFSLAFGSNLDAHSRPPEDVAPLKRGGLPISDDDRQCLEGRLCYSESITLTIVACLVAFGLSVVAGYRDHRKRSQAAGLGHARREVMWEGEEETS